MEALKYSDVTLVPNYSELDSRSFADTSVEFLGKTFVLPIIPANMSSVIDENLARYCANHDIFYIMHRFNIDLYKFVVDMQDTNLVSISCGVNLDNAEYTALIDIADHDLQVDFITIDVAHGHHVKVQERITFLRKLFPKAKIIAGNVATRPAANSLEYWGADAIKVGIGGGSICSTRYQTGFHVPMFTCVNDIFNDPYQRSKFDLPVIADGGIEHPGDIAKALVAGATMVMAGGLFAPCIDSPAKLVNGKKQYNGSTSFAAKGEYKHIEGITLEVESSVTFAQRIQELQMALQSSISYAGGKDLSAFRNVNYRVVH